MTWQLPRSQMRDRAVVMHGRDGRPVHWLTNELGAVRTTALQTLLAVKNIDVISDSRIVTTAGTGVISHEPATSTVLIVNDVLQSRWYVNYQPGKRQVAELTYSPSCTGVEEIGLFDAQNGFFLRLTDGVPSVVHRAYGTDYPVARTDWQGDKVDGTGHSLHAVDFTKAQRLFIRYAWLGLGDAEIGFVHGDEAVVLHRWDFRNSLVYPHLRTPSLPLRWQSRLGAQLRAICGTVASEGGQEPMGLPTAYSRDTGLSIAAGVTAEICSVRLKAGIRNTAFVVTGGVAAGVNDVGMLKVLWNPTYAASTGWSSGTVIDNNVSGRTISADGVVLHAQPFSSASREGRWALDPILPLTADYAGTADTMCLAVKNTGGSAITVTGALGLKVIP